MSEALGTLEELPEDYRADMAAARDALKAGAQDGSLSIEAIDRSASRILTLVFNSNKMKEFQPGKNPDLEAHARSAELRLK